MLFNSFQFLIFLPIVVFCYFAMPFKCRKWFLLISSYYFYMCWKPEYIILIIVSTLIDYFAGIQIAKQSTRWGRKKFLILSLLTNLGLLFSFKYFNFFNDSFRVLFNCFNMFYGIPAFKFLLPVGISFYTFQTLSYSIDVYYGKKEVEKDFGIFALYVAFFPQLVAGPIERSTHLLPQFKVEHKFDYERTVSGLYLMAWGLFKKMVVADNFAPFVEAVYSNPQGYSNVSMLVATLFFAIQIFCDFSGYSDIAIGSARIMGFDLMVNFRSPYFSKNIREFWSRWHISLSTWFRDYVYFPLGGSRVSKLKQYRNFLVVFAVSGLWHGANWTFLLWGFLHGAYLVIEDVLIVGMNRFKIKPKFKGRKFLQIIYTFNLVLLSWVFFRAQSLREAFYIIPRVVCGYKDLFSTSLLNTLFVEMGIRKYHIFIFGFALIIMEAFHYLEGKTDVWEALRKQPLSIRWSIYVCFVFFLILTGQYGTQQFIYFQF